MKDPETGAKDLSGETIPNLLALLDQELLTK